MLVLAVDTTTEKGSVAVVAEDAVRAEVRFLARDTHSRHLLPAIEFVLRASETKVEGLGAFAVACGPGSFTGLRVGISTVQGLAMAAGRGCVAITALDTLAFAARGQPGRIVVVREAFRGEVFWGVYDEEARPTRDAEVGSLESALGAAPSATTFVGDLPKERRAAIVQHDPAARFARADPYLAATLGRIAIARVQAGETPTAPEDLRPFYLRGADIRKATV
jgi:tRNA threonylcarbamoyladenosine biosynthesis protein TsaB